MFYSKRLKCGAAILAVTTGTMMAAAAVASTPSGVTATIYATGEVPEDIHLNSDRVKIQTKDSTSIRVQELTFAPGGYSGWHHHPGVTLVVVKSGTLTLTQSDCTSHTYGAGQPDGSAFIEGGDEPHQASSAGGATITVTYVVPTGEAPVFREEDDAQIC